MYILPSSLIPSQKGLSTKTSLFALFIPKSSNEMQIQLHQQLQEVQEQQLARLAVSFKKINLIFSSMTLYYTIQKMNPANPALNGTVTNATTDAVATRFMNGVRFNIVGYPADKKINNIIRFLVEHGGAIYKEKLDPNEIDLIVVCFLC